MHESEQRRRLSPPAARAAPPASPRPFPQPDPSPQSPSSVTSLCRVLACKVADPPFVLRRVIGQKRIDQNLGRARLDAKCGMAVPCLFHRNCLLGNVSLYRKCKLSSQLPIGTFDSVALPIGPTIASHCCSNCSSHMRLLASSGDPLLRFTNRHCKARNGSWTEVACI